VPLAAIGSTSTVTTASGGFAWQAEEKLSDASPLHARIPIALPMDAAATTKALERDDDGRPLREFACIAISSLSFLEFFFDACMSNDDRSQAPDRGARSDELNKN
jgi:hypothetical protein